MNLRFALSCSTLWLAAAGALAQASEIPSREAAAKENPRDPVVQTALGVAYLRAGRYAEADAQLARAQALAKDDPASVLRRAEVAIAQGDAKRARSLCKGLFSGTKGPPLAHVCMARAYLAWNRSERAFEELELALAQDPELGEAQLALGHAHRLRSQVAEAEAAYLRARATSELAGEACYGLGQLYAAAGRKAEAIEALRAALDRDPSWPDVQYALALLLDDAHEAEALLQNALMGRPKWAEAAAALGDVLSARGEHAGAEAAYRKALRADGSFAAAHTGLAQALLAQERVADAESAARAALALVPNDARATRVLAEVLVRKGAIEEALENFRRAADMDARDVTPLYRAAQVALENGRATTATGYLERLLGAQPQHEAGRALYGEVMRVRGMNPAAARTVSAGALP